MLAIDNILVSDDILEQKFLCDLTKCKGGCCEEGDAGAPLEDAELSMLNKSFAAIEPMLSERARTEIEKKGRYVYDREFGWVTTTIGNNDGICVYALKDEKGCIKCSFEKAYQMGLIEWKKPISCHLFPIVTKKGKHGDYHLLNYEPRPVLCKGGCALGNKMQVPAYQFLKEPIIRKFGESFYQALEAADNSKE